MSYMQSLRSIIQRSDRLSAAFLPTYMAIVHPASVKRHARRHCLKAEFGKHTIDIADEARIVRISRTHAIYANDIVNGFEFFHGAVAPEAVGGNELVDYSVPKFHQMPGFPLHPVFFNAIAEPLVTADQYIEFAQLGEASVALDLGAYSGLTSILFREQCGMSGTVIAVEADPDNIAAVAKNIELYESRTGQCVELFEGAVWIHDEGVSFSAEGNLGSSATDCVGNRLGLAKLVPSARLSTIARRYELPRVDFIKCDIEGAEGVIFGDADFFERFQPRIIVEVHPVDGTLTTEKVKADLSKFGYTFELVDQLGSTLPLLRCIPG
jgi:FkbM family methyltransferase